MVTNSLGERIVRSFQRAWRTWLLVCVVTAMVGAAHASSPAHFVELTIPYGGPGFSFFVAF